ncbi:Hypothetical predicted protein [Pelobates cultripes]|uniref:Uncharacterized protein n=1 Tax=Pelobates cultripes TaxID=61616 RepID=A0AAD1QX57_PELCU|nr:Hypothetical predicted protein [Pelobates cultripes]
MGKHSRKSRGLCESHTRDISFLLTQPSRPKMADRSADTPRRSTSASEEEDPEPEDHQPHTRSGRVAPQWQPDPQLATKTDITAMMTEINAYIASEMVVLKTDLSSLAGRIQSTEETSAALESNRTLQQPRADGKNGTDGRCDKTTQSKNPWDPKCHRCWRTPTVHQEATLHYSDTQTG